MNPDGDAVGAVMGIYYFLRHKGLDAVPMLPDPAPERFRWMDEDSVILNFRENEERITTLLSEAELIIALDFNNLSRIDAMASVFRAAKARKVLIDHHLYPQTECFDQVFSTPDISSASELAFQILLDYCGNDISQIPFECLNALTAGMLSDTNSFNNSVFPSTMRMAAMAIENKVDLEELNRRLFHIHREERVRMIGHCLLNAMVVRKDLEMAYVFIDKEIKRKFCYQKGDGDGLVNQLLDIPEVHYAIVLTEDPDRIRVSVRSKTGYSAQKLCASKFNGGGHEKASGGHIRIAAAEVPAYVERSMAEYLKEMNADE
mgnify:FL=1